MRPRFDDRDARIVAERCAKWEQRDGPRVGDFCQLKDGSLRRFTYDCGDVIQTTPEGHHGSFHLHDGFMIYSGSLDTAMPKRDFERFPFARKGPCWIFHHGHAKAHNDVHTEVNCRVYMEV